MIVPIITDRSQPSSRHLPTRRNSGVGVPMVVMVVVMVVVVVVVVVVMDTTPRLSPHLWSESREETEL